MMPKAPVSPQEFAVEVYRTVLMEQLSDVLSMEQVATAAYEMADRLFLDRDRIIAQARLDENQNLRGIVAEGIVGTQMYLKPVTDWLDRRIDDLRTQFERAARACGGEIDEQS